ncbi:hypothetical protein K3495_g13010, partial [Podosphaera aphanis]
MEDNPFEDSSSKNTGNTIGSGGGAGTALPKIESNLKKFKRAIKENNAPSRAVMGMLEKATQDLARTQNQSWAKVASQSEVAGTTLRIQNEEEIREISKLLSEELVKKIGLAEVISARPLSNGQVKIYFTCQETKEMMERQTDWTKKFAPTAQVANPWYQVLVHNMPLSFNPANAEDVKELQQANAMYIQGIRIQKAVWLKKNPLPGKSAGSMILWLEQAESANKAISKGIMWKYELKATEIFRSGFRAMQCFNCQKYGHIAKMCTAEAKCGHCAGKHNTRECSGKQEVRCRNCGKKHASWHQSCPVKIAAKAKAVTNRTQDPGRFVVKETRAAPQGGQQDNDWQIVGSRKRRGGVVGLQTIGADGEVVERRGPGRPRKTTTLPNMTAASAKMPILTNIQHPSTEGKSRSVARENHVEYNVNKSKDRVQQYFLHELDPRKHHLVAIQEPWRNPTDNTTVRHPAYHLVFPGDTRGRTCIYVSKHLAVDKWRVETAPADAEGDITSISLRTNHGKVWVHSIYNPPPLHRASRDLGTLQWIPQILAQDGHHVLVGDFNLHHPRWGGKAVVTHHKLAEDLIDMLGEKNIELILPEGTITWSNRGSQSTLDLTFVSKDLEDKIAECQPANELEASSDHIPICTGILIQPEAKEEQAPRPQWKKAD